MYKIGETLTVVMQDELVKILNLCEEMQILLKDQIPFMQVERLFPNLTTYIKISFVIVNFFLLIQLKYHLE